MSEQKCTYASALAKNKIAKLEAERDAALAVVEKMREALSLVAHDYANGHSCDWKDSIVETVHVLALQPDLTALRKRDAELLRDAAGLVGSVGAQMDLRDMADRIEKGEPL